MNYRARALLLISALLVGACASKTICVRLLGITSLSVVGLVGAVLCGALWCVMARRVPWAMRRARYASVEFVAVVVAAGIVGSLIFPVGPSLDWRIAIGPAAGESVARHTRQSWGETGRVFELHANPFDQQTTGEWPSRAEARLNRSIEGVALRIRFRVTQADWVVDGALEEARAGTLATDGFVLRFQAGRDGEWRTLLTREFDFFRSEADRTWHPIVLDLNETDDAIAVEVLSGGEGSNNWYDRVWINTLQATARVGGFDANQLVIVADAVTLLATALAVLVLLATALPDSGGVRAPLPMSPATPSCPTASERLCDWSVGLLALWTVCCHVVVIAGGGLQHVLWTFGSVLVPGFAGLRAWRRFPRRSVDLAGPVESSPIPPAPPSFTGSVQFLTVLAAAAGILVFLANDQMTVFWWGCVLLLLRGLGGLLADAPQPPALVVFPVGRAAGAALWLLAAGCAVLALLFHHQGLDDSFYVNVAVAAADNPRQALMSVDTMHGVEGLAMHMPAHRLHSFELLNGAVAYLTGLPAIEVFHWGAAGLIAFFAPLSLAYLLRRLTPGYWLASTVAVLVVMICGGERLHWYGNELISYTWYGKSAYLFAILPLAYAYGLRFGARPTAVNWLWMAAVQIAAVGCTSSALWSVPIACCLAAASSVRVSWRAVPTLAAAALASVYVIGLGLYLKPQMSGVAAAVPQMREAGALLREAMDAIVGDGTQRLLAFGAIIVLPMALARGLGRRFGTVVSIVIMALVLSPYTERIVSRNLTGPSYWRAFWSLPLPLLMGLVATAPLQFAVTKWRRIACGAVSASLLGAFAFLAPIENTFQFPGGWWAPTPELKVPKDKFAWAQKLNRTAGPGAVVLAPQAISAWIPTLHHHAYPLVVREIYLRRLASGIMGAMNAEWRLSMTEAVSDRMDLEPRHRKEPGVRRRRESWAGLLLFRLGLDAYHVSAVCINRGAERYDELSALLRNAGFERRDADRKYEIWLRRATAVRATDDASRSEMEAVDARHE